MNYGIDFKGGSLIEVQAKNGTADLGDIRAQAVASSTSAKCRSSSSARPATC